METKNLAISIAYLEIRGGCVGIVGIGICTSRLLPGLAAFTSVSISNYVEY